MKNIICILLFTISMTAFGNSLLIKNEGSYHYDIHKTKRVALSIKEDGHYLLKCTPTQDELCYIYLYSFLGTDLIDYDGYNHIAYDRPNPELSIFLKKGFYRLRMDISQAYQLKGTVDISLHKN